MRWLFLLLLLPLTSCAQIRIPSIVPIIIGNSGGGVITAPVDTSFEERSYASIKNVNYNILRPNISIPVTGNMVLGLNNIYPGKSGQVRFVLSGTDTVTVNGTVGTPFGTSGTYIRNYNNTGGVVSWP